MSKFTTQFSLGMLKPVSYKRHRFPPQVIALAVWLYFRFP
jgi:putative transposase